MTPRRLRAGGEKPYPAIARQAKQDKADVYFWDESGFRADPVQGTTWGAKGQTPGGVGAGATPGIRRVGRPAGAFWFATYADGLNGTLFVTLLRRMMRGRRKPLHLIVDGLRTGNARYGTT